jgi:hypothetical protein
MTPEEKKIDELYKFVQGFARRQSEFNIQMTKDVGSVVRGLYGDERNNQKGLIHAQQQDDLKFIAHSKRIHAIEKAQYKQFVWVGVGSGVLTIAIQFIKSFWK